MSHSFTPVKMARDRRPERLELRAVEPRPGREPVDVRRNVRHVAEMADRVEMIGPRRVDDLAPWLRPGRHDTVVVARGGNGTVGATEDATGGTRNAGCLPDGRPRREAVERLVDRVRRLRRGV